MTPYCLAARDEAGRCRRLSIDGGRTDDPARVLRLSGPDGVRVWAYTLVKDRWRERKRLLGRVLLVGPFDEGPDHVLILDRFVVYDQLIGPLPAWWFPRWMQSCDDPAYPRTGQLRAWVTVRREVELAGLLGCDSAPIGPPARERRCRVMSLALPAPSALPGRRRETVGSLFGV